MRGTLEYRVLCLSLRRPQGTGDLAALRGAIEEGPDWTIIIKGVRRHRVAPLVVESLRACASPLVPAYVINELRTQSVVAARRSLAQVAEIRRLGRAFADAGIRVLVLKGEVLSAQIYGGPGLRAARDIDLLADPDRVSEAETLLTEAGYRRMSNERSAQRRDLYRRWIKEIEYYHPPSGTVVELHHRLTDNPRLLPLDFDTLWREREVVQVGGCAVPTLSQGHLPLYLCVHGANHGWERLRWLVDFAAIVHRSQCTDEVLAAAHAVGIGAAMLHGLSLAHDWLGLPVDQRHLAAARASARVRRLDRILAHLYEGAAWHEMPQRGSPRALLRYSLWLRLYALSLKSSWRYRANEARRAWFAPADWDLVRLPDSLLWLYQFVRPFGWLLRRMETARRPE